MVGKKMLLWVILLLFTATPNLCYGGEEMALSNLEYGRQIWSYLIAKYPNPNVVAGIMGNLYGESSFRPYWAENYRNAQGVLVLNEEKAKEYTRQINNKTISRYDFIHFGYLGSTGHKGYGIAQWTSEDRKQLLYDTMFNGYWKGIDDLEGQVAVLISECENNRGSEWDRLREVLHSDDTTIEEATEAFIRIYERPLDVEGDLAKRIPYAHESYQIFYGEAPEPIPPTPTPPYAPIPVPYSPIFPQKMNPIYYTNPYLRRIAFRNVYFK